MLRIRHRFFILLQTLFIMLPVSAQAVSLTSIVVDPVTPAINIGEAQQLTATGIFDDGSMRVLGGNGWISKAPIPLARTCPGVSAYKDKVYVIGGKRIFGTGNYVRVDAYDPRTNAWTPRPPVPEELGCPAVAVDADNGVLYAIGYTTSCSTYSCTQVSALYAYHFATNTWVKKASMLTPKYGLAVAVVNGTLYTFGGISIPSSGSIVEAYNPTTDTWATKSQMPMNRHSSSAAVINGKIYLLAGIDAGSAQKTITEYDPATDSWTSKSSMPIAVNSQDVGVIGNQLYVVGGSPSSLAHRDAVVQAYDSVMDNWTIMASIPATGPYRAAVSNEKLYALNINYTDSAVTGLFWRFVPAEAKWLSSDASIATVNGSGLAQATATAGTTTITVSVGSVNGSAVLTSFPQPVYRLNLTNRGYGNVTLYSDVTGFDFSCSEYSCQRDFPKGTKVELVGSSFTPPAMEWQGACAGQGTAGLCKVTMDSDLDVKVLFPIIPY